MMALLVLGSATGVGQISALPDSSDTQPRSVLGVGVGTTYLFSQDHLSPQLEIKYSTWLRNKNVRADLVLGVAYLGSEKIVDRPFGLLVAIGGELQIPVVTSQTGVRLFAGIGAYALVYRYKSGPMFVLVIPRTIDGPYIGFTPSLDLQLSVPTAADLELYCLVRGYVNLVQEREFVTSTILVGSTWRL
jgi:hypothetical protein